MSGLKNIKNLGKLSKIAKWSSTSSEEETKSSKKKATTEVEQPEEKQSDQKSNGQQNGQSNADQGQQHQASSIAERTQKLYSYQSSFARKQQQQQIQPVIAEALENDLESHRVMYQYLFTENKKKTAALNSDTQGGDKNASATEQKQFNEFSDKLYLSALNTRRNPDLIVPGGKFLKGNMYFQKEDEKKECATKEEGEEVLDKEEEDEILDQDAQFERMKNQQARYFIDSNPTVKCRNCQEYGHMARNCTNDRKKKSCILCGKDTHDSFECTEKNCFKCNMVGHLAMHCQERNIIKCNRCLLNGHKEMRCLKLWRGDYSDTQLNLMRCVECGKSGHMKCTKEKSSKKIPIDTMVRDDLDEFKQVKAKKGKSIGKDEERQLRFSFDYVDDIVESASWVKHNTNVLVPEISPVKKKDYNSVYREAQKNYGVPKHHQLKDQYCCYCGGKHKEDSCINKKYGNQKFQQFEKVRERLNYQNQYDQYSGSNNYNDWGNNRDYRRNDNNYNNNNNGYAQRLQNDPRRNNVNSKPIKHRKYEGSSESSSSLEDYSFDSHSSSSNNSYSDSSDDDDSDSVLVPFNQVIKSQSKNKQQQSAQQQSGSHRTVTNSHHSGKHESGKRSRSRDNGGNNRKKDRKQSKKKDNKSSKHFSGNSSNKSKGGNKYRH